MPELPEVETTCRGLKPLILNKKIISVKIYNSSLRYKINDNLSSFLNSNIVTDIKRKGKYILISLSNSKILLIHLGMSGRLLWDVNRDKHDHVEINFQHGQIFYRDPRRFGFIKIINHQDVLNIFHNSIDPVLQKFTTKDLLDKFNLSTSIKTVLMNQKILLGIGNIYASEILFYAKINPERISSDIKEAEVNRIRIAMISVLKKAIDNGGTSISDYQNITGVLGNFQNHLAVYQKEGQKCPSCSKENIIKIKQQGRSTFLCKGCQI